MVLIEEITDPQYQLSKPEKLDTDITKINLVETTEDVFITAKKDIEVNEVICTESPVCTINYDGNTLAFDEITYVWYSMIMSGECNEMKKETLETLIKVQPRDVDITSFAGKNDEEKGNIINTIQEKLQRASLWKPCSASLYMYTNFFNHSCVPNATKTFRGGDTIVIRAISKINEGDQITISYTNKLCDHNETRKKILKEQFGMYL